MLSKQFVLAQDFYIPENIDYKKLKKMTDWIYRTAWKVVNAEQRPATNPDFKLER